MSKAFFCNTHECTASMYLGEAKPGPCKECKQDNWVEVEVANLTAVQKVQALETQARALLNKLFDAKVLPCSSAKSPDFTTCLVAENHRPLTPTEKGHGRVARHFDRYDPDRMCLGCRAYWYAALSRDSLARLLALTQKEEAQTQIKTVSNT